MRSKRERAESLAIYLAIGFILGMLAIAVMAVTGYFLWEAGLEAMGEI